MARLQVIFTALCCCVALTRAGADTFKLNNGNTISGDIISFDANGAIIRQADGTYTERTPWSDFSQANLQELVKNPKMQEFVEPFVEPPPRARAKPAAIEIKDWPHLQRAPAGGILGALFSSGVGILAVLLVYAANIYAGMEIAIFRNRPTAMVAGLAAIPFVGVFSNIAFLALPPPVGAAEPEVETAPPPAGKTETAGLILPRVELVENPLAPSPSESGGGEAAAAAPTGLRLAHETDAAAAGPVPESQVFQRGAFTFNRRFFETKFPGFFGVVRRESEKNMVLEIKSLRGSFVAQRISRISSNELHVDVHKGHASEEVTIPFSEIQEVKLKHKDT